MGYATVGSCPRCGAPIYAESPWFSILPPPSRPSCSCFPQSETITTNTTSTETITTNTTSTETIKAKKQ